MKNEQKKEEKTKNSQIKPKANQKNIANKQRVNPTLPARRNPREKGVNLAEEIPKPNMVVLKIGKAHA
ncbi:hypothetical protein [Staphylococcus aureus]|uniref:hypothetical protein n=1 Tax=Staphylococcus aureus TaxID=1280 RepID=UPI00210B7ECD|nr:hypothetical protein [Staphylococcus aureus]